MSRLVKQVHAEHGRLDGVVYGAGVIADQLIAQQDPVAFERVIRTKVDGASALLRALDPHHDGIVPPTAWPPAGRSEPGSGP